MLNYDELQNWRFVANDNNYALDSFAGHYDLASELDLNMVDHTDRL